MNFPSLRWRLSVSRSFALLAPAVLTSIALLAWRVETAAARREAALLAHSRTRLGDAQGSSGHIPAAKQQPWPDALPVTVSARQILARIRQVAEDRGVSVLSVNVAVQAPTAATLGRLTVDLDLRGTYSTLKDLLADVTTREPGKVFVQAASHRRRGNAPDLDSHVQLVWPSRALEQ